MQKKHYLVSLLAAASIVASASVIVTPDSISYVGSANASIGVEANIINGNGLTATPTISNYTEITHALAASGNIWATDQPNGETGDFFNPDPGVTVVFEITFNQTYELSDFLSWNYHVGAGFNGNDISQISVDYGIGDFSQSKGTFAVAQPGSAGSVSQTSIGTFQADQVRITVTDNDYHLYTGGDRVGLAEIRFIGTAVPEPSTYAALSALTLLLAIAVRRRMRSEGL